jgi:predicted PurR-regulated permease PerM
VLSELVHLLSGEDLPVQPLREMLEGIGLQVSANEFEQIAGTLVKQVGLFLNERLGAFAADAIGIAMQFVAMVLLVFTLLVRGQELKAFLMDLSPLPADEAQQLIERFKKISRAVFVGNGVGSLLQGVFGGIGFAIFGLGSAVIWGTAMGLLALLPVFGASVIFVPAAAYLFLTGKTVPAALFLAYNLTHVGLLEYGLKPKLIGTGSQMNAVLVFLSILGGLSLFGVLGIFYGPLIVAMFLAMVDLYKTRYRKPLLHDVPEEHLKAQG